MVRGPESPNLIDISNTGQESIATCPANYFMTGCQGFSYFKSTTKWAINDNDECVARAVDPWNQNYSTTAAAIWSVFVPIIMYN